MHSFIDSPADAVDVAVEAYCRQHSDRVARLRGTGAVVAKQVPSNRVALLCGGGSGHEPAHIGYVQQGLLSAAVCGDLFASPPTSAVTAAIQYLHNQQMEQWTREQQGLHSPPGVLVIVKNYTGDCINFGYAVREARSRGIPIEMVVVGDDVAFGCDHDARRGIAGTLLLYKILGAAAAQGRSLAQLVELSSQISANLRSFGASLTSCNLFGSSRSSASGIPDGFVELGLGIHGERGLRQAAVNGCTPLVQMVVDIMTETPPTSTPQHNNKTSCVLFLNNLGSTTDIEMGCVLAATVKALRARGIAVELVGTGRCMTALDMHGVSWTMLSFVDDDEGKEFKNLVLWLLTTDDPSSHVIPFGKFSPTATEVEGVASATELAESLRSKVSVADPLSDGANRIILTHIFKSLADAESTLNEMDAAVGDGDTGFGVARAAKRVLSVVGTLPLDYDSLPQSLALIGRLVADAFAGSTGPLYGAFLIAAAESLQVSRKTNLASLAAAATAFVAGTAAVGELGRACLGERTMMDVLIPVGDYVMSRRDDNAGFVNLIEGAAIEAEKAAKKARMLQATKGRSRYMGGKEIGLEDPGCELVALWLRLLHEALTIVV